MLLLALLTVSACGDGEVKTLPATAVLVTVAADEVQDDLASIEVTVFDSNLERMASSHSFALNKERSLPVSFGVTPPPNKSTGTFVVVATGKDSKGNLVVENKARASFVSGKTVGFVLWLLEGCRGVICTEADQTCSIAKGPNAGKCDEIPTAVTREVEPGDELNTGKPPILIVPDPTDTSDAGSENPGDASAGDAGEGSPTVQNVPTVGGFSSLGEPRYAGARGEPGTLLLYDDGFETGGTVQNADGWAATAGFLP